MSSAASSCTRASRLMFSSAASDAAAAATRLAALTAAVTAADLAASAARLAALTAAAMAVDVVAAALAACSINRALKAAACAASSPSSPAILAVNSRTKEETKEKEASALVGAFAPPIMVVFFRNHRKEMRDMSIMVAIATMMPILSERRREEGPGTGRVGVGANAS